LGALVLAILIGLTLSAPASVAACICNPMSEGDVVFDGIVVDSPNDPGLLHDIMLIPGPGLYAFDVESVAHGDALDGRVHTGPGNCSSLFELGATYRIHARVAEPSEKYLGMPPGVSLTTNMCMANELREPPPPLLALGGWARSSQGLLVLGSGLFFVIVGASYLWYSRRTSNDPWRNHRSVP
jgi:hypothetical protein